MLEYAIVIVILLAAGGGTAYWLYRSLSGKSKCSCNHCPTKNTCESDKKESS